MLRLGCDAECCWAARRGISVYYIYCYIDCYIYWGSSLCLHVDMSKTRHLSVCFESIRVIQFGLKLWITGDPWIPYLTNMVTKLRQSSCICVKLIYIYNPTDRCDASDNTRDEPSLSNSTLLNSFHLLYSTVLSSTLPFTTAQHYHDAQMLQWISYYAGYHHRDDLQMQPHSLDTKVKVLLKSILT